MRYAVISDVHGNIHALRAVVAAVRRAGVDAWLCLGDIVGYGPAPNACIDTVVGLGATTVAGNHEHMVLGRLSTDGCLPLARRTVREARSVITPDRLAHLDALPDRASVPGVVLTHAALGDVERYVADRAAARDQLARLAVEHPDAAVLLVGHTHRPRVEGVPGFPGPPGPRRSVRLPAGGRVLLNPGAVGQSRRVELSPRARALILDVERREARFLRVPYDVAAARADLASHGLPSQVIHMPPSPARAARRVAARAVRAARSASRVVRPRPGRPPTS